MRGERGVGPATASQQLQNGTWTGYSAGLGRVPKESAPGGQGRVDSKLYRCSPWFCSCAIESPNHARTIVRRLPTQWPAGASDTAWMIENHRVQPRTVPSHLRNVVAQNVNQRRRSRPGLAARPRPVFARRTSPSQVPIQERIIFRASGELAALLTAVDTSKRSGQHDCHQQAPGSENEHIGYSADVKLPDVAHKEVSRCCIERAPEHVDRWRRLSVTRRGSELVSSYFWFSVPGLLCAGVASVFAAASSSASRSILPLVTLIFRSHVVYPLL